MSLAYGLSDMGSFSLADSLQAFNNSRMIKEKKLSTVSKNKQQRFDSTPILPAFNKSNESQRLDSNNNNSENQHDSRMVNEIYQVN